MKALLRRALARFGYELRHRATDPLVAELDELRHRLRLDPDRAWSALHLVAHLGLAAHLRALLALQPPDLVVDVGANRGQFARWMRQLGYQGTLVSLEPQPALAATLRPLAATDRNWTIIEGAVSDVAGETELQVFDDDTFSSLQAPTPFARRRFGGLLRPAGTCRVRTRRLDDWIGDLPGPPARRIFLKTDTQGHDLFVLRGAPALLSRSVAVLAEGSITPLYEGAPSVELLQAFLAPAGFRPAGVFGVSHDPTDGSMLEADCLFTRAGHEPPTPSPSA